MLSSKCALIGACLLAGGLSAGVAYSADSTEQNSEATGEAADASLGEALFLHNWARPEEWTRAESLGEGGDGLGPVFNEVSCVACHSMGGVGGAGGNEHNVELLSVVFPRQAQPARRIKLLQRAKDLHPQFAPNSVTVMLHHYGFGAGDDTFDYDSWRAGVTLTAQDSQSRLMTLQPGEPFDDVPLRLSQRNTPAVWGSGLLERLRRAGGDRIRSQIAQTQNGGSRGVSGRIPRTMDGRSGWYGWRGHVDHLPEFVMSACANELGLAVANHPQPASPREKLSRPKSSRGVDLTKAQVVALTRYVGSLPRPEQVFPTDAQDLEDVYAGERVFESTGCAECHVPTVAFVKGLYSDLLLHDMGTSLSDPVSAFPETPPPRTIRRTGGYSGGGSSPGPGPSPRNPPITRTRLTHEWRTPPLWGVADSPPYLHDGRAQTLDEAIRLHEGEAKRAADDYQYLTEAERSQLLRFLGTLRAPQTAVAATSGSE